MKSVDNDKLDTLSSFTKGEDEKTSLEKANSERAYWIEATREALGEPNDDRDEYEFGQIAGLTGNWSVRKLQDRYTHCVSAKMPFAPLWWYLYSEDKKENDERS